MTNSISPTSPRDPFGPSDSSDSASERPPEPVDTDAAGTGERASVEPPTRHEEVAADIDADQEVSADEAGVSRAPADPVRNGGMPPASGNSLGGEDEN